MKDQYILVLEDNPQRHAIFRKNFADGNHLVIVETAKEAIALLDNERWDFLFLDHDLGGQIMVPSGPDTGYEVALWLEAHVNKNPDNIIIHSHNIIGSAKMHAAIKGSYLLSGAWMHTDLISNWEIAEPYLCNLGLKSR